jgi:hypothetical protein
MIFQTSSSYFHITYYLEFAVSPSALNVLGGKYSAGMSGCIPLKGSQSTRSTLHGSRSTIHVQVRNYFHISSEASLSR